MVTFVNVIRIDFMRGRPTVRHQCGAAPLSGEEVLMELLEWCGICVPRYCKSPYRTRVLIALNRPNIETCGQIEPSSPPNKDLQSLVTLASHRETHTQGP